MKVYFKSTIISNVPFEVILKKVLKPLKLYFSKEVGLYAINLNEVKDLYAIINGVTRELKTTSVAPVVIAHDDYMLVDFKRLDVGSHELEK